MDLKITTRVSELCPKLNVAMLRCEVVNSSTSEEIKKVLQQVSDDIKCRYKLDQINSRPEIEATRAAYKALGKDPHRYRPSAEALCRRIMRDIPVYTINTLVDILNIVSIRSGFSICGFDAEKIHGTELILTIGSANDTFDAIGRGILNVEGLPMYKDDFGGIGTPTSDNERTKITEETTDLLIMINSYSGNDGLPQAVNHAIELLGKFATLKTYELKYY